MNINVENAHGGIRYFERDNSFKMILQNELDNLYENKVGKVYL